MWHRGVNVSVRTDLAAHRTVTRVPARPGASVQAGPNRGNGMIRTLIAEQTSLIRAGLVALLSGTGDIDVIAELQRGDQVVSASLAFHPDVAVLDAALPGADGFAAARALHAELPSCRSLIMSERRDPASLRRAVAAHATGFVVRDVAPDFMAEAVRRVAKGKKVVDPELAFAALNTAAEPADGPGTRRPPARRRRFHDGRDCRAPVPFGRHRAELPLAGRHQDRWPQPRGRYPDRRRRRLVLSTACPPDLLHAFQPAGRLLASLVIRDKLAAPMISVTVMAVCSSPRVHDGRHLS